MQKFSKYNGEVDPSKVNVKPDMEDDDEAKSLKGLLMSPKRTKKPAIQSPLTAALAKRSQKGSL
jgi:hypothetical protein